MFIGGQFFSIQNPYDNRGLKKPRLAKKNVRRKAPGKWNYSSCWAPHTHAQSFCRAQLAGLEIETISDVEVNILRRQKPTVDEDRIKELI